MDRDVEIEIIGVEAETARDSNGALEVRFVLSDPVGKAWIEEFHRVRLPQGVGQVTVRVKGRTLIATGRPELIEHEYRQLQEDVRATNVARAKAYEESKRAESRRLADARADEAALASLAERLGLPLKSRDS